MGWLSERRALRHYRKGVISLNDLLDALGLPRMVEMEPKSKVYYQNTPPRRALLARGDMWIDTRDARNVMSVWSGVDWDKVQPQQPGMTLGPEGLSVVGSIHPNYAALAATAADAAMTTSSTSSAPTWREDWDAEAEKGDAGLAMLLWGRNLTHQRSARTAADAIERAGWGTENDMGVDMLTRILVGKDCRDWRTAEEVASLVEAIGWSRYVPTVGHGWMGSGSNPLTEDEESAIVWAMERGADPVALFNDVLANRPVDYVPTDGPLRTSGMIGKMTDPYGKDFGRADEPGPQKPEETRQTWAILADVHEQVEGLLLDPQKASEPHCVEEYNGGLMNALAVINAAVHEQGGHVEMPDMPPGPDDDQPEPGAPQMPQMPTLNITLPPLPQIDTDAISARIEEVMAPFLAAVAASVAKGGKGPKRPQS